MASAARSSAPPADSSVAGHFPQLDFERPLVDLSSLPPITVLPHQAPLVQSHVGPLIRRDVIEGIKSDKCLYNGAPEPHDARIVPLVAEDANDPTAPRDRLPTLPEDEEYVCVAVKKGGTVDEKVVQQALGSYQVLKRHEVTGLSGQQAMWARHDELEQQHVDDNFFSTRAMLGHGQAPYQIEPKYNGRTGNNGQSNGQTMTTAPAAHQPTAASLQAAAPQAGGVTATGNGGDGGDERRDDDNRRRQQRVPDEAASNSTLLRRLRRLRQSQGAAGGGTPPSDDSDDDAAGSAHPPLPPPPLAQSNMPFASPMADYHPQHLVHPSPATYLSTGAGPRMLSCKVPPSSGSCAIPEFRAGPGDHFAHWLRVKFVRNCDIYSVPPCRRAGLLPGYFRDAAEARFAALARRLAQERGIEDTALMPFDDLVALLMIEFGTADVQTNASARLSNMVRQDGKTIAEIETMLYALSAAAFPDGNNVPQTYIDQATTQAFIKACPIEIGRALMMQGPKTFLDAVKEARRLEGGLTSLGLHEPPDAYKKALGDGLMKPANMAGTKREKARALQEQPQLLTTADLDQRLQPIYESLNAQRSTGDPPAASQNGGEGGDAQMNQQASAGGGRGRGGPRGGRGAFRGRGGAGRGGTRDLSTIQCWHCGEYGHFRASCPTAPQEQNGQGEQQGGQQQNHQYGGYGGQQRQQQYGGQQQQHATARAVLPIRGNDGVLYYPEHYFTYDLQQISVTPSVLPTQQPPGQNQNQQQRQSGAATAAAAAPPPPNQSASQSANALFSQDARLSATPAAAPPRLFATTYFASASRQGGRGGCSAVADGMFDAALWGPPVNLRATAAARIAEETAGNDSPLIDFDAPLIDFDAPLIDFDSTPPFPASPECAVSLRMPEELLVDVPPPPPPIGEVVTTTAPAALAQAAAAAPPVGETVSLDAPGHGVTAQSVKVAKRSHKLVRAEAMFALGAVVDPGTDVMLAPRPIETRLSLPIFIDEQRGDADLNKINMQLQMAALANWRRPPSDARLRRNARVPPFRLGDLVLLRVRRVPRGRKLKLAHKWAGPFRIMELTATSAVLQPIINVRAPTKKMHLSNLTLYKSSTPLTFEECATQIPDEVDVPDGVLANDERCANRPTAAERAELEQNTVEIEADANDNVADSTDETTGEPTIEGPRRSSRLRLKRLNKDAVRAFVRSMMERSRTTPSPTCCHLVNRVPTLIVTTSPTLDSGNGSSTSSSPTALDAVSLLD